MLVSEILGWQWVITWDNPQPADSSALRAALKKLGKITDLDTKTTVLFAPKKHTHWRMIWRAITKNMSRHPKRSGKVVYVNLRSKTAWQWRPGHGWHHA